PLHFRRRPPQSNCPSDTVQRPDYGTLLEPKSKKGGISTLTPPRLAPQLPSLPPILHILNLSPISNCSKAPWGLFALPRVTCIFTGISISPDPSLRQRPDRYAIRAGRNLPDKEFRYLSTVIVTAAVYRGFNSGLAPLLLTFRHRAVVRPYTSSQPTSQSPVFLVNSRYPRFRAPRPWLPTDGALFSRSYEGNLPRFFTIVLSSALVCSTSPPVSVSGTVSKPGFFPGSPQPAHPIL